MDKLSGELKLRPTRIGFLLRPGDHRSLRRIVRLCACLWGGTYNPLIPVCRVLPKAWRGDLYSRLTGKSVTQGYLRFFEPDVYVEAQPGLAIECGIDDDSSFGFHSRVVPLDEFVKHESGRAPEFAYGLSIFDVYRELYAKEYRFQPRDERNVVLFDGRSSDMSFIEAVSGAFPKDETLGFIRRGFVDAFKPEIRTPTAANWLDALRRAAGDPLGITRYGIDRHPDRSWNPRVFVVDPTSPLDILDLWNLRLFHDDVLPVNVRWLKECRSSLRRFIERSHRPLPGNDHGLTTHCIVEFGRSIDPEVADQVSEEILGGLPERSWVRKMWYDRIWDTRSDDIVVSTERSVIEARSVRLDIDVESEAEPMVKFPTLSPDFAARLGGQVARWANVLRLTDYFGRSGLALTMPSTPKKLMSPWVRRGRPLIVSREGFVLPQAYKNQSEFFILSRGSVLIVEWLRERGVESRASEAGKVVDQVINAVNGIWGASLLADAETLKLLDKMSKSVRRSVGRDGVEEYPDRTAGVSEWQGIVRRRKDETFAPRLDVQSFVNAGALKLGLAIRCPNCDCENWYGVSELQERLSCERCLGDYDFPQGTLNFGNTPWRYRVTGPFSVPNYANGAYSTVLTLRCLTSGLGFGRNNLTYCSSLNLDIGGESIEVDFACWYRRDLKLGLSEEPLFVMGEVKSFADKAIQIEDVRRLRLIGAALPGTVLVIAVLKEELSSKERRRLASLALWGRKPLADGRWRAPVVILTGGELFANDGVQRVWREHGGLRSELTKAAYVRMDNLVTLADLTQQVHLNLPSYWSWFENRMDRWRKHTR